MERTRDVEDGVPTTEEREGAEFRRVGVDGREFDRAAGELKFAGI